MVLITLDHIQMVFTPTQGLAGRHLFSVSVTNPRPTSGESFHATFGALKTAHGVESINLCQGAEGDITKECARFQTKGL